MRNLESPELFKRNIEAQTVARRRSPTKRIPPPSPGGAESRNLSQRAAVLAIVKKFCIRVKGEGSGAFSISFTRNAGSFLSVPRWVRNGASSRSRGGGWRHLGRWFFVQPPLHASRPRPKGEW